MSVDEQQALATSIAATISDYRDDELDAPTSEHVQRWIEQFDLGVQLPVLRELDHVLDNTYFGRTQIKEFLEALVRNPKLAGADPERFWPNVNFLDIQVNGRSQDVLLGLFSECLDEAWGFSAAECGSSGGPFVYLDDALFSGGRVGQDVGKWLAEDAPSNPVVHVIVVATHAFGEWKSEGRLQEDAAAVDKKLDLTVWRAVCLENRFKYRDRSEVLWPASLPDDAAIQAYAADGKFPFEPRKPGGKLENEIFSGEEGRHILEQAMLSAGARIRAACQSPKESMRPLGFSPFGLGFGSTIVTFRNCPNNAPLALWWGDPEATPGSALDWYPLVPRKTYAGA